MHGPVRNFDFMSGEFVQILHTGTSWTSSIASYLEGIEPVWFVTKCKRRAYGFMQER